LPLAPTAGRRSRRSPPRDGARPYDPLGSKAAVAPSKRLVGFTPTPEMRGAPGPSPHSVSFRIKFRRISPSCGTRLGGQC
jgi:hypothetical protein